MLLNAVLHAKLGLIKQLIAVKKLMNDI